MDNTSECSQIVTASHAFLGGKLNLAHAAAVYLPASVDARLGHLFGRASYFATGIDVHGRQGERILAGKPRIEAEALKEKLVSDFLNELEQLGIHVDIYLRTDAPEVHRESVKAVTILRERGLVGLVPSVTLHCSNGCGDLSVSETQSNSVETDGWKSHTVAAKAQDLRCVRCGAHVQKQDREQYALDLNAPEDTSINVHKLCSGKTARKLLSSTLRGSFHSWTISRTNYYGMPFPDDAKRSLYVWFPALVSKVLLARRINLSTKDFFLNGHVKFYFAKNIVQYYAKVFPLILEHCYGVNVAGYSYHIRGFCDIERSAELLDVDRAISVYGLHSVRFFCLYSVIDDAKDFVLCPKRLEAVNKGVLNGLFGRFLKETEVAFDRVLLNHPDRLPSNATTLWRRLDLLHRDGKIRSILLELEQAVQSIQVNTPENDIFELYQITRLIMEEYVPGWYQPAGEKSNSELCSN